MEAPEAISNETNSQCTMTWWLFR